MGYWEVGPSWRVTECVPSWRVYFVPSPLSLSLSGTRVWAQDPVLAGQGLCHLSHAPNLFCFRLFQIGSHLTFCLRLTSDNDPPTWGLLHSWDGRYLPSHLVCSLKWGLASMTITTLNIPDLIWNGVLLTFAQAGLELWSSWSFTSQAAVITDVSYHVQLLIISLLPSCHMR
jgi:hypothetical protein